VKFSDKCNNFRITEFFNTNYDWISETASNVAPDKRNPVSGQVCLKVALYQVRSHTHCVIIKWVSLFAPLTNNSLSASKPFSHLSNGQWSGQGVTSLYAMSDTMEQALITTIKNNVRQKSITDFFQRSVVTK
jgi:hypothetical protein